MMSIYLKELRENLKWALLVLGLFGFFLAMGPSKTGVEFYPSTLADVIFIFGAGGAGLLMGLFQIVFEAWTDKWAFLIHRPLSRTRIFLAKMLAGWTLLTLALGIPWLISVIWSIMPGHRMAPFYWQMLLPPIADILCSFIYWFAGMLVGLRAARWYGSRIMPIALPGLCSFFVFLVPEFWQALLIIMFVGVITALAAWGTFRAGGAYESQPHPAKPALGLCLAVGIALALIWGAALVDTLLEQPSRAGFSYAYAFDPDGNPLRMCDEWSTGNLTRMTFTDMEGRPLSKYPDMDYQTYSVITPRSS